MQNKVKPLALLIVLSFTIVFFSCLTEDEKIIRTPEMEASELTAALNKLITQGYDVDTATSGIYYIVHEEGTGALAVPGDTCYLEYGGYLLDGTLFDASADHYANSIWPFIYKEIDLIPGFDAGIALMNKGMEVDVIIPSSKAYGAFGSGIIAPYSTLLFSLKMHDLKPKSE